MNDHPIEALLRPPVEFWSVLTAGCASALCFAAPHTLLMPKDMGLGASIALGLFAFWRFRQGMRAVSYQRNLRRLPVYTLPANRIPVSDRQLFLGLGFRWGRSTPSGCATPSGPGPGAMSNPTPCTALPEGPRSPGNGIPCSRR